MEVVVTIGAVTHAEHQSNCHHQESNSQLFIAQMPFLLPNQLKRISYIIIIIIVVIDYRRRRNASYVRISCNLLLLHTSITYYVLHSESASSSNIGSSVIHKITKS